MDEIDKELDKLDLDYEKGDQISGSSVIEGSVSFTWKGKNYDLEIEIHENWDKYGDYSKHFEIEQPKDISDDDWDLIRDEIESEVK